MIAGLVITLLIAWLVGWLVVSAAGPGPGPTRAASAMRGALAAGLGLGLCSAALVVAIDVRHPSRTAALLADLTLVVLALLMWARRPTHALTADGVPAARCGWIDRTLAVGILLAALMAVAMTTLRTIAYPHGDWDAWAIWNMKARFMARGGGAWRAGLAYPVPHPDYPLLVPGAVAREWIYLKQEARLAPAIIASVFTAATVVLASSCVFLRRGRRLGLLAAILLLGTPYLIAYGTSQCADVPVGFFLLAALALLTISDHSDQIPRRGTLLLAGLALGLGAWTKDEGILYLVCVVLAHGLVAASQRGLRVAMVEAASLVTGASPLLAILAHHRATVPASWLFSHQSADAFTTRALDAGRYRKIGWYVLHIVPDLGGWSISVLVLLVLCALAWGLHIEPEDRVTAKRTALVLGFALLGLFGVYLASPSDLDWQLPTSLPRLLIQLWPSAVVLFALVVRTPTVPGDLPLPSPAAPAPAG